MSLKQFIFFYFILFNSIFISHANTFNCNLPERCQLENQNYERNSFGKRLHISCFIKNEAFEFKFKEPTANITAGEKCFMETSYPNIIRFQWMSNNLTILEKQFNFSNVIRYFNNFENPDLTIQLLNLKGFDVNLTSENDSIRKIGLGFQISVENCQLDFYHKKKKINSCPDFFDSNITEIQTIFQTHGMTSVVLLKVEYKQKTCPIVFNNSRMQYLDIDGLVDTFYKKNVISFSNENYTKLNSMINWLRLENLVNINLDLNILHPSVFNNTEYITINGFSLNKIDGDIFVHLKNLKIIFIYNIVFRKINHKQGIYWIREWNKDLNVNLSSNNIEKYRSYVKEIQIIIKLTDRLTDVLPEEDFCIYAKFPFNQLVIFYVSEHYIHYKYSNESTCTYLWLVQYYKNYVNIFNETENMEKYIILIELDITDFKSISKCDFEQKISLCNKSNYQIKDIWDQTDFFILNKKLQIAFKLLLYSTAFLGLIANIIVVVVIRFKDNKDLFKDMKHYSYLCLNSIFCIMISVIEILSWMNECFYPFEVFCPEIRKLVAIQFFKIIFKECFVTLFRFMCNFTYVAFALNRISLIGKDHGKLVTFFSEIGIKKYIGITLLISASFSWIKGLKYQVNYNFFYSTFDFPLSNDDLLFWTEIKPRIIEVYYVYNSISDFINYFLFVVISAIIDICMVVQLRRVLEEKTIKSASINQKQNETKKAENEEVVNKAIKMVVINTSIGIFFKLPALFIPIINVYADFYFSPNYFSVSNKPYFDYFYSFLKESEFLSLIQDISTFLFTLALSIQMFIYNRFDKKFQTGYQRLKDKAFTKLKNVFKSQNQS